MRSAYWLTAAPATAIALAIGRWLAQGSGNIYTDAGKRLYVPDPDLGWRLTDGGPIWLGLDLVAACAGALAVAAAAAWWLSRRDRAARVGVRRAVAGLGVATLAVPIAAFASGSGPTGARARLPDRSMAAAPEGAVDGALPALPAGNYTVLAHPGTRITARVTAGGETFEARFAGDPRGALRLDPADLAQPVSAEIAIAAASVDTGIELRSKHAREELRTGEHPDVRFRLGRVLGVTQLDEDAVAFTATGTLELIGRDHEVRVEGELRAPATDARARLGIPHDAVLVIRARTQISIEHSAIDNDGTYESDTVPIDVSLVLARIPTS